MKTTILLLAIYFLVDVRGQQCPESSMPDGWVSSDADFWKGVEGKEFITELDESSHDSFTKDNEKAFIMYYTTWCGYSKQARNGFAGAAKNQNGKVSFGAVDCDKAKSACQVRGYPTFRFYKDGAYVEEYRGQRTTQAFVRYLNRK